jgi:hypothetical protein
MHGSELVRRRSRTTDSTRREALPQKLQSAPHSIQYTTHKSSKKTLPMESVTMVQMLALYGEAHRFKHANVRLGTAKGSPSQDCEVLGDVSICNGHETARCFPCLIMVVVCVIYHCRLQQRRRDCAQWARARHSDRSRKQENCLQKGSASIYQKSSWKWRTAEGIYCLQLTPMCHCAETITLTGNEE